MYKNVICIYNRFHNLETNYRIQVLYCDMKCMQSAIMVIVLSCDENMHESF